MTPTCVVPRHVDALRDFLFYFYFLRTSSARGGGGGGEALTDFFVFFCFPCSADHERDWSQCKEVSFGLATNALNVRNNKKVHSDFSLNTTSDERDPKRNAS